MKKVVACCCMVATLAFSLVGCSDKTRSELKNGAAELSSYSDVKIGVCIYQLDDNFMSLFRDELVRYLLSQGFSEDNIIIYGSDNNQAVQLSQVEDLLGEDVDALIINPVNASVAHTITDMATQKSVPLVYINREPSGDEENRWVDNDYKVTYVGCDARQSGIYQGEILLELGMDKLDVNKNDVLEYYMIEGAPENVDAGFRTMYSVSTLQNAGIETKCLLDEVGNWDRMTAENITSKGLDQNLVPDVIICNNDAMALGAIEAVRNAGLKPGEDVFIVGVDALPEAVSEIKNGSLCGSVFNDFILQSHEAADACIRYLKGESCEHFIGCDYVKVTRDNVDDALKAIEELGIEGN
nr:substrate-binding domain-containing protein [uncultured Butyrivibrio sp.]